MKCFCSVSGGTLLLMGIIFKWGVGEDNQHLWIDGRSQRALLSRSVTMGGSCILLFLCFRHLGLYFVFEKSTKSSFYFRCFKLAIFEYRTIKTVEMRMQWIIWFVIFNLNLICILTNQICPRY